MSTENKTESMTARTESLDARTLTASGVIQREDIDRLARRPSLDRWIAETRTRPSR